VLFTLLGVCLGLCTVLATKHGESGRVHRASRRERWFTDPTRETIGHVNPTDDSVRMFGNGLAPVSEPGPPVVTSDGAVWFAETNPYHRRVARIARDGTTREFAYPRDFSYPRLQPVGTGVAFWSIPESSYHLDTQPHYKGPEVMVLRADGTKVRVRTTAPGCSADKWVLFCLSQRHEYRWLQSPSIFGDDFVLGPDRNVWFADGVHDAIGRITPAGRVTYFTRGLTRWNSGPRHFTVGPDGAVWFTEIRSRVGRITMDGRITEFSAGIPRRSFLGGIVTGPDKNLWFTLYHGNELARITPRGVVTRFRHGIYPPRGNDSSTIDSIPFVDRSGRIWFNEPQGGRIARATIPR